MLGKDGGEINTNRSPKKALKDRKMRQSLSREEALYIHAANGALE
jgi:hypothetical protein